MNLTDIVTPISRQDLDEILFRSLRSIHKFERAKVARFGLNYESIFLLQFLMRKSPAKMSEIAAELALPISTVTRIVDRLEANGVLARKKDKQDKRIILVSLKAKGKKMVRQVEEHTFEILLTNLGSFNADQIKAFIDTATHMEKILAVPQEPA